MFANRSRNQVRTAYLSATVGDHAACELAIGCGKCGRQKLVPLSGFPSGRTIGSVVFRLRCQGCGLAPSVVRITDGVRDDRAVTLLGDGAYG